MRFLFLSDTSNSDRPKPRRLNRGQGGAVEQLAKIGDLILSTEQQKKSTSKAQAIPDDVPENDMAPPIKPRRGVSNLIAERPFWLTSLARKKSP